MGTLLRESHLSVQVELGQRVQRVIAGTATLRDRWLGGAGAGLFVASTVLAAAQFKLWNNNNVYVKTMTDNWSAPNTLGSLGDNEGIYVDTTNFKIAEGKAKGDPAAELAKSGAKQVAFGW